MWMYCGAMWISTFQMWINAYILRVRIMEIYVHSWINTNYMWTTTLKMWIHHISTSWQCGSTTSPQCGVSTPTHLTIWLIPSLKSIPGRLQRWAENIYDCKRFLPLQPEGWRPFSIFLNSPRNYHNYRPSQNRPQKWTKLFPNSPRNYHTHSPSQNNPKNKLSYSQLVTQAYQDSHLWGNFLA